MQKYYLVIFPFLIFCTACISTKKYKALLQENKEIQVTNQNCLDSLVSSLRRVYSLENKVDSLQLKVFKLRTDSIFNAEKNKILLKENSRLLNETKSINNSKLESKSLNHASEFNQSTKGRGFGSDAGNGTSLRKGEDKKPRIRLTNPSTENIASKKSCKICLKLTINANGDILKVENIVSKSTTDDLVIINQVIENVKSQVKYNKVNVTELETTYLTINISAK